MLPVGSRYQSRPGNRREKRAKQLRAAQRRVARQADRDLAARRRGWK